MGKTHFLFMRFCKKVRLVINFRNVFSKCKNKKYCYIFPAFSSFILKNYRLFPLLWWDYPTCFFNELFFVCLFPFFRLFFPLKNEFEFLSSFLKFFCLNLNPDHNCDVLSGLKKNCAKKIFYIEDIF